jgi:CheY-like chemotaxis protein
MDRKNIVIIDDNKDITESLNMMLSCYFEGIKIFNDSQEGLSYLVQNNKDLDFIVCDINMPELDGIELLKKYRQTNTDTPFAFYSGHAEFDPKLQELKKEIRIDGIITKPSMEIIELLLNFFKS